RLALSPPLFSCTSRLPPPPGPSHFFRHPPPPPPPFPCVPRAAGLSPPSGSSDPLEKVGARPFRPYDPSTSSEEVGPRPFRPYEPSGPSPSGGGFLDIATTRPCAVRRSVKTTSIPCCLKFGARLCRTAVRPRGDFGQLC